jgi:hypothetical protein
MEETRQDAVLHMVHLLTRFPPAVRAAYILMRRETPRLTERAVLGQCLYEVLKSVVSQRVIQSDPKRYFEGSRLLFGLILEKAKNLKVSRIVYGESNTQAVASYWGPRNTTRSLGSAVFRYYRAKFSARPTIDVEQPFVF